MRSLNIFSLLSGVIVLLFLSGCKKNDNALGVETTEIIEIGHKTALAGGTVISGENLCYRGLCWGTSDNPTIENDRCTAEGTTSTLYTIMGPFDALMTSLKPNTTYYYRAYVNNTSSQVAYGQTYSFTTLPSKGTVTDIEGNVYQTAQIGDQLWMAENLKSTHFLNGDVIPTTVPDTLQLGSGLTASYQWAYNSSDSLVEEYGRLYNWYAVIDPRNVCPTGWHIPNDNEWNILFDYLGGDSPAVNQLKEAGRIHWLSENLADNNSDFTALPGGYRIFGGNFSGLGQEADFWSSMTYPQDAFYSYELIIDPHAGILRNYGVDGNTAFSVRCIKD
jgi:uncharacterized protein (TIGR02145 family)